MAIESEPEPVIFVFRVKTEHNLEHLMSVLGRSEETAVWLRTRQLQSQLAVLLWLSDCYQATLLIVTQKEAVIGSAPGRKQQCHFG